MKFVQATSFRCALFLYEVSDLLGFPVFCRCFNFYFDLFSAYSATRFSVRCLMEGRSRLRGLKIYRLGYFISQGKLLHRPGRTYGSLNFKKLAGCEASIGMTFEKAPVPSSVPVRLVVQLIGADRLVAISQV